MAERTGFAAILPAVCLVYVFVNIMLLKLPLFPALRRLRYHPSSRLRCPYPSIPSMPALHISFPVILPHRLPPIPRSLQAGRSLMSEARVPQDVISGWFNYGFKLGLMKKDVDIANDLLDEHFAEASIIRNTQRLMKESLSIEGVHADSDYTEVIKVLESQCGEDLRASGTWEWKKG